MKRTVILFVLLLAGCNLAIGQEIISITKVSRTTLPDNPRTVSVAYPLYEHMQYRDYRQLYDARNYYPRYDDPYEPFLAGLASYFIPGLGQCVCGEAGRGIGFFLGTETLAALSVISFMDAVPNCDYYYDGQSIAREADSGGLARSFTLLAGACALYVWNVIDAGKVAKIKNMYYHDVYDGPAAYEPAAPVFTREVNPYMRYREYKNLYSTIGYRTQWGDPYNPTTCGVVSALLPGLGQCVAGEWGRGALFFGGYALLVASIGQKSGIEDNGAVYVLPMAALAGLYIWNICDAVKVAKIKNLYTRDLRGQMAAPELRLEPYINNVPAKTGNQLVGGLALKVNL